MKQISSRFKKYKIVSLFLWITVIQGQNDHNNRISTKENVDPSYFFYQQPEYPRDCYEILNQCSPKNSSGVHLIKPDGYSDAFEVYCDNIIEGGGWTVVHRRTKGAIEFHRTWKEYKNGFGFLSNEYWIGLERLSFLTNQKEYEIRIDMKNAAGSSFYIQYDYFCISDEYSDFRLLGVDQYSGTADDVVVFCPRNMQYGNCTCQATCEDPEISMGCRKTCQKAESCVCQEGFLKKGNDCVPPQECGCFIDGVVIPDNQTFVNIDCSRSCRCQSNVLICDDNYGCSSDATCEERNSVRQCYCNDGYTGDGQSCEVIATDCADIYNAGVTDSGVYTIKPTDWPSSPFEVYCNMTDGGGWTVFQRRLDGSENFYLGWNRYKEGFGSLTHEIWLGNERLYYITKQKSYQLRIDWVSRDDLHYYAKYNLFRISNEDHNYTLTGLGSYTGNTGYDSMNWHRNRQFSTHDRDNDGWSSYNCAQRHAGAWWYGQNHFDTTSYCSTSSDWCEHWPEGSNSCGRCGDSNLNGDYDGSTRGSNIYWERHYSYGYYCSIKHTEMKIKPI